MSESQRTGRRAVEIGLAGRTVSRNLVRLRRLRGLTTRQLSAELARIGREIPATGITRIEKRERRVDVDDLTALASALNVTIQQLLDPPTECGTCHGTPPVGFTCKECGAGA